ncbi:MAG: TetR/AcrR family transcriptional regulator [Spirochaetaceae bacterium]|nr:MAG: TetR/AcrR family transcriptional regulator [Spirochaetaceae bacterium]
MSRPVGSVGAETRVRIIREAEHLFAERGFEGARMEELARRTGVNKAAIYHYFRGKEAILEELIAGFLAGSRDSKTELLLALLRDDDEALDSAVKALLDYLGTHRDLLAVIVSEATKSGTPGNTALFRYVQASLDDALEIIRGQDPTHPVLKRRDTEGDRLLSEALFGLFLPILMYAVLGEAWSGHRGVPSRRTREWFIGSYRQRLRSTLSGMFE